ncbi:MAG: ATP-binding protein [Thermodesulfobacteriota bacterium]|nr:ATP-binding protein [Thermodesulfobacteriota bacterium]
MPGKRIIWKLFFAQTLLILISIAIIGLYAGFSFKDYYISQLTSQLESNAILIRGLVKESILKEKGARVDFIAKKLGREIQCRVTIIDTEGIVLGDSEKDPQNMENHLNRPEVKEAMKAREGKSIRYSTTLKKEMMYLALPIKYDNQIIGTVRVSLALDKLKLGVGHIYRIVGWGGMLAVILSLLIAFTLAKRISRPISQMAQAAKRISRGDFGRQIVVDSKDEVGDLAQSFNLMSEELKSKIEALIREVGEKEAVLTGMIEGVIAIDKDEHIILLNKSAQKMFGLRPDDTLGRFHWEGIRNTEINNLFKEVLKTHTQKIIELPINPLDERTFEIQAAPILDREENILGVVTVFHDITEIKRLEQIRMEFISNVSHELKTPLTSIKAAVETLKTGAINEKEHACNFLDIIERHSDRLDKLIADLLDLSQIETGKRQMIIKPIKVMELVDKVVSDFRETSIKRHQEISVDIPEELPMVLADEEGIETVLRNLLDNAMKYTPENGEITIAAIEKDAAIEIVVADTGIGIPEKDTPRIFERFYRVDKARSRELGGTGLGLSIVKHIIEALEGTVSAESEVGKGSKFIITLPKSPILE